MSEREKGMWILEYFKSSLENKPHVSTIICSQCGNAIYHVRNPFIYHYCPHCGAKMEVIKK